MNKIKETTKDITEAIDNITRFAELGVDRNACE